MFFIEIKMNKYKKFENDETLIQITNSNKKLKNLLFDHYVVNHNGYKYKNLNLLQRLVLLSEEYREIFDYLKNNIHLFKDDINNNDNGVNTLLYACATLNIELVELLLKNNIDPNSRIRNGETVLMYVSSPVYLNEYFFDSYKLIKLLLDYNADPNMKHKEYTAFTNLCGYAPFDVSILRYVKLFLEYNADPNITHNNINLAVYNSIVSNESLKFDIIKLLLEKITIPFILILNKNIGISKNLGRLLKDYDVKIIIN
jgi:ankyrin repeat protein